MKSSVLIMLMTLSLNAFGTTLHLDLEMTTEEYQALLDKVEKKSQKARSNNLPEIENALKIGARLSKWIALINENRTPETAIRLTSANTRRGIPIDQPNFYSPAIIEKETRSIINELPKSIKEIILGNGDLPIATGMEDEAFIFHARRIDRNYQSAARFKTIDQYRSEYIRAANKDVRGFHYLMVNKITEESLQDITKFPASTVDRIKNSLIQMCLNGTGQMNRCTREINKAANKNELAAIYKRYIKAGQRTWDNFFKIPTYARRHDFKWGQVATVPFNTPSIPKFIPYLQNNVEDEFRWGGWRLKVNFGDYPNAPFLKFEPGVVPHVNELGGNQIVMDSNQPIEEYESQWTIRHEFGHIIGLPDCYHEFYDVQTDTYVNYQLDTTDLMCSRAGNMNERIYLEIKSAYENY